MGRDRKRVLGQFDLPKGYRLLRLNNSHYGIIDPLGERLRDERGLPLQLAFSPTGNQHSPKILRRVERAIKAREER